LAAGLSDLRRCGGGYAGDAASFHFVVGAIVAMDVRRAGAALVSIIFVGRVATIVNGITVELSRRRA